MPARPRTNYSATVSHAQPASETTVMSAVDDELVRTKILLYGQRRAGKTSIQEVLFNNLEPKQSFFIDPTRKISILKFDSIIPLEIWDVPGNISFDNLGTPLNSFSSIIYVIDIQDSYQLAIERLIQTALAAVESNPGVCFAVFVHKAEALSEDFRIENFRHIEARIADELADLEPIKVAVNASGTEFREMLPEEIGLNYYLTSVYDHSVHFAFSGVLQRLLEKSYLPYLEDLLNVFYSNSQATKAFLFDTQARIQVATDNAASDAVTHNICCDYVKMLNSFAPLYKSSVASPTEHPRRSGIPKASSPAASGTVSPLQSPQSPFPPPLSPSASISTTPSAVRATSQRLPQGLTQSQVSSSPKSRQSTLPGPSVPQKPLFYPSSSASLTPYTTLIYHAVNSQLALIALFPTSIWESKRGLIEYNVVFFREGVQEICDVIRESRLKPHVQAHVSSLSRR